jgi:hypothetical protein
LELGTSTLVDHVRVQSFPSKAIVLHLFSITHNIVEPIDRHTRPLIGRRRGQRHTTPPFAEMWIGISAEEKRQALQALARGWVTNRYPLRELGMTRADCERWLWDNFQRVVPKSACLGCLMWNIGRGGDLARRT